MGFYNSFVVKVWSDDMKKTLRGQVWHVNSHKQIYFDDLDKAMVFIKDNLNPSKKDSEVTDTGMSDMSKSNGGVTYRDG